MIGNVINQTFNQGGYVPLGGHADGLLHGRDRRLHGLLPALGGPRLARGGDVSTPSPSRGRERRMGFDRPRFLWALYAAMLPVSLRPDPRRHHLLVQLGQVAAGVRRLQLPLVPHVLGRPRDQELAGRELRGRGRDDGGRDDPRHPARVRARAGARPHRRVGQHPHAAAADHARDRDRRRPAAAVRARRHGALATDDHPRPHHVLDLVRHRDRARAPLAAQPRGRGGRDGSRRDRTRRAAARDAAGALSGDPGLRAARVRALVRRLRDLRVHFGRGHLAPPGAHLLAAARGRVAEINAVGTR